MPGSALTLGLVLPRQREALIGSFLLSAPMCPVNLIVLLSLMHLPQTTASDRWRDLLYGQVLCVYPSCRQ